MIEAPPTPPEFVNDAIEPKLVVPFMSPLVEVLAAGWALPPRFPPAPPTPVTVVMT